MGHKNNLHANDQQYTFFSSCPLFVLIYGKKNVPWHHLQPPNSNKKKIKKKSVQKHSYRTHTQNKQTILLNNCNILQSERAPHSLSNNKKKPQLHHIKIAPAAAFPY